MNFWAGFEKVAGRIGPKRLQGLIDHNKANPARKAIHITYRKANGRTVKRRVDPLELKMDGKLLVGWDHKRQAVRSYRMERMKGMEKAAFWQGFDKHAMNLGFALKPMKRLMRPANVLKLQGGHLAEIAGLGILAVPSIQHMRGKPMLASNEHKTELAGLGLLAAPSALHLGKAMLGK